MQDERCETFFAFSQMIGDLARGFAARFDDRPRRLLDMAREPKAAVAPPANAMSIASS